MLGLIKYDGINARRCAPRRAWRAATWSGRPPAYREPLLRKTVTLPVSYAEQLTTFGAGNLCDGIRLLAETASTRGGTPWLEPLRGDG